MGFEGKRLAPLSVKEIYERIDQKEVDWVDWVRREDQKDWKRILEVETFKRLMPEAPKPEKSEKRAKVLKSKRSKSSTRQKRSWFLYYSESQFGPFAIAEVQRLLRVGKIHGGVYAWTDGLENWKKISRISEFSEFFPKEKTAETETVIDSASQIRMEMREAPRKPLVARLLVSNDETVVVGMCRDISLGGMQVLTERGSR